MRLAQKTLYAIKAIYSLAEVDGRYPLTITQIAEEHDIPAAFLQNIMRELKSGGYVESKRGKDGGYVLSLRPENIRVGDIIKLCEGELFPVDRVNSNKWQDVLFEPLWIEAATALENVYMSVTFSELVDKGRIARSGVILDYVI